MIVLHIYNRIKVIFFSTEYIFHSHAWSPRFSLASPQNHDTQPCKILARLLLAWCMAFKQFHLNTFNIRHKTLSNYIN